MDKCRTRQVDFLIVTANHACVVELKNYSGVLIGGENGQWSKRLPDGGLEVIDRQNPYNQASLCKMAVSDDLHDPARWSALTQLKEDTVFQLAQQLSHCIHNTSKRALGEA
jgi:hypothetical protein